MRPLRKFATVALLALTAGAADAPRAAPAPTPAPAPALELDPDALYDLGKNLFDQLAPDAVKADYEFPSKAEWDSFAQRLSQALAGDSLAALARYAPEARAAGTHLPGLPADAEEFRGWLEQRLDEVAGAQEAEGAVPSGPPRPTPSPEPRSAAIPYYGLWQARVRARPLPAGAPALMPTLRAAFAAEGVPPELAWIAEAESSLNPSARSPAGARGLFQLMPDTARELGLSTFLPDDRTNPEKSAHAAARRLRALHAQFGTWPLALAAYNAGAGRVARAVGGPGRPGYAGAAGRLPAETRMYVPKVCALVALRTGVGPDRLPPPRR